MIAHYKAALGAASRSLASCISGVQPSTDLKVYLSTSFLGCFLMLQPAQAGLYLVDDTPLQQFGFSTAGQVQSAPDFLKFFDATVKVLGDGAAVRTGLGWDPTRQDVPGFAAWSDKILEPALARNITILPGIRTLNLDGGGYRMPTDAQWVHGLRQIVRMYGPNGVYQKGGSYMVNGRTMNVAPHPEFEGLTDFELWNEPNTQGNLNGAMTPARITQLLKIGSEVMRDEAKSLGFQINIIGPAIGGIDLDYMKQLKAANANLFGYVDTVSFHAYTRFAPSQCDAFGTKKVRCVESFEEVRKFMDANGGAHVHLGTTEGGVAGDSGTCIGPQVRTEEQQRDYTVENLLWLRGRPWLKFDFWITPNPIDGTLNYSYACDSKKVDIPYWETKLGVIRADGTLKPLGVRYRDLLPLWKQ